MVLYNHSKGNGKNKKPLASTLKIKDFTPNTNRAIIYVLHVNDYIINKGGEGGERIVK